MKNILVCMVIFPVFCSAQSVRAKITRAAQDPTAEEKAAKADVRLHDKKIIYDTATIQPSSKAMRRKQRKKG